MSQWNGKMYIKLLTCVFCFNQLDSWWDFAQWHTHTYTKQCFFSPGKGKYPKEILSNSIFHSNIIFMFFAIKVWKWYIESKYYNNNFYGILHRVSSLLFTDLPIRCHPTPHHWVMVPTSSWQFITLAVALFQLQYTVRCRYNAVNCFQNIHKIHTETNTSGWGTGCLFVV